MGKASQRYNERNKKEDEKVSWDDVVWITLCVITILISARGIYKHIIGESSWEYWWFPYVLFVLAVFSIWYTLNSEKPFKSELGKIIDKSELGKIIDKKQLQAATTDINDPNYIKKTLGKISKDDIPGSSGEFGLVESNPVPLNTVFASYGWLPLLRYPFKTNTGFVIYLPVKYDRIGSVSSKFGGSNDIWELFDISGLKLATIYLNGYQSYTSVKAPKGFFLSGEVDKSLDAEKVLEKFKNLSEEEKLNLNKERFNDLFSKAK